MRFYYVNKKELAFIVEELEEIWDSMTEWDTEDNVYFAGYEGDKERWEFMGALLDKLRKELKK